MAKIFLSYRRADSQAITDRIYETLVEAFGKDNVFQDVSGIPAGVNFKTYLERAVGNCDVLLVIIGQQWLTIKDDDGNRRLDNPSDFVRIEIEAGLKRDDVLVIPLLVDNARMPTETSLPESLRSLHFLQSARIRYNPDFTGDMQSLIQRIRDYMKESTVQRRKIATAGRPRKWRAGLALIGIGVLATLVALAVINPFGGDGEDGRRQGDSNVAEETPSEEAAFVPSPTSSPSATSITPVSSPNPSSTNTSTLTETTRPPSATSTVTSTTLAPSSTSTPSPTATRTSTSIPTKTPHPPSATPTMPRDENVSRQTHVIIPPGESIEIGLATDLSNVIPDPGLDIANGSRIAVMERNEAGGILGFPIELNVQDDRCVGEDATNVASLFASDPEIAGVVGHVCSGASSAAADVYVEARIPMVSPSSASPFVSEKGYDIFNRVAVPTNAQSIVVARYLFEVLGVNELALIHDGTDYGMDLVEAVQTEFERLGGRIVNNGFIAIDPESQDYRATLSTLRTDPPTVIFFGGYETQATLIATQLDAAGLVGTILFSGDGVFTQHFIGSAGSAAEGQYVSFVNTGEFQDTNAIATFDARYNQEFGVDADEMGPFHAHAYDATNIILNAIASVAYIDGEGNLIISREALIRAVRNTTDYKGLTGTLTCDPATGECAAYSIEIYRVVDGSWVDMDVPMELQVYQPPQ